MEHSVDPSFSADNSGPSHLTATERPEPARLAAAGVSGVSGVGVLDRAMAVFDAVLAGGEASLGELISATGLPKATTHRLAVALVDHGLLRRTDSGRFSLGLRLVGIGRAVAEAWPLASLARPALERLREATGESVQLYVRDGDQRVCLVSLESAHELRTIVSEGARLPLGQGSAGRILAGPSPDPDPKNGRRWVSTEGERAPGVGSISAPVLARDGRLVAAAGVSGPLARMGGDAADRWGPLVAATADEIASAYDSARSVTQPEA